jgi:Ca-activated chloride channel family protein
MAKPEGAGWSLRIPLTTAPRYVRKDEFSSRFAHGQPLALLRDPGHRFAMDLKFYGIKDVACTTHKLKTADEKDYAAVSLLEGEVIPDRDCVLTWKPEQDGKHPTLRVICQPDRAMQQTYFIAMIAPPSSKDMRKVPGEYIILVDHSGSMSGSKWEAADWAVEKFLLGLDASDAFALGVFHSTTKWFSKGLSTANEQNVKSAIDFLHSAKDNGGTELGVALEQALNITRTSGHASCHLLIITDAEVSDEGRLLRLVSEEAKNAQRRRISILCIDAAPNSFLAGEIAERGGGVAKFLTSNPDEGDISTALDNILEDWQQPVMTGLQMLVNRPKVDAIGRESGSNENMHWYVDMGDLPAGRTIWVCGRFPART